MSKPKTIGQRLRKLRTESTMTQERLAEMSGISIETIRKLEQGVRSSARLPTLHALARALGVPTTALLGDASKAAARREPDHRPLSLAGIRRVLTPARGLVGTVATAPDEPPPTLDAVRAELRSADAAYHRGDYGTALAEVPRLLDDARRCAEEGDGSARAYATLAQARYLATELLIQLRAGDLAYAAVSGALDAAQTAGDPLLGASTVKAASWLLLRQGRLAEAEEVAVSTADSIEPRLRRAEPAELAVWGWLLLAAAAAAARDNRPDDAGEMLDAAAAAAARLGDRPVGGGHLEIVGGFRAARVDMMRVEVAAVAGDAGRALSLSEQVPTGQTTATSWRRHRLDVAWSHVQMGAHAEATGVLLELRGQAAVWLRQQRYARDIFTSITEQRRRAMTAELAELAVLLG